MADPAYFASAAVPADNGSNGAATCTITPPASMEAGDLVVVKYNSATSTFPFPTESILTTGGQEWTGYPDSAEMRGSLYWCTFNGTWDADPQFTTSLASPSCISAIMHVFRGQGPEYSWILDAGIAGEGITGPVSVCPLTGVTTTRDKAVALGCWYTSNAQTWGSLGGTDWVVTGDAQYRNIAGGDQSLSFAHKLMPVAGATGDTEKTKSGTSGRYDAFTIAFANVAVGSLVYHPKAYRHLIGR